MGKQTICEDHICFECAFNKDNKSCTEPKCEDDDCFEKEECLNRNPK